MSDDPERPKPLTEHPGLRWDILGKVVENLEIGAPDDVILIFEDGSKLQISNASKSAKLVPCTPTVAAFPDGINLPLRPGSADKS